MEEGNDEQQEEIEPENNITDNDPVALAEFKSKDTWEEHKIDKFSIMAISEGFEVENSASLSEDDLNGPIVKLKIKTEDIIAIADFGNSMSILNEKTALRLQ